MHNLTEILHQSLGRLKDFERCALLDYPDYTNIGDHLIWIGSVFYITEKIKAKISYASSINNFSGAILEKQIGKAPILLNGGGNLGDLWPKYQAFREYIISHYRDRPVIILPQSIYFANPANLDNAAKIFNSHPDLTLFVRDDYSYEIATKNFKNCQVVKAPDMAFQLSQISALSTDKQASKSILYHCRQDQELSSSFAIDFPSFSSLVVEDWTSFKWVLGTNKSRAAQTLADLFREVWQRGIKTPGDWMFRQKWEDYFFYNNYFNNLYNQQLHSRSWSFIHSGIYQFKQHQLIITNRLHGHILCVLLGLPHIFLPNSYHKNESFYNTWTYSVPFCRFAKDSSQVITGIEDLLKQC
ncbi:MAG: polysaccharide pyruvyl transferase family protein [Kastovskya adunca ATA6-11-RM4]|jgi:pyruvyl transferase EpsO|nr:polysaccharide pyruvyl transferase family protein [Kastovskya adunca ATA6-11-RM4]